MKQCQEIKQNWTGQENFEIYFCVIFDHYYQFFIYGRKTGYKALSPTIFCDIANIS